MKRRRRRRHRSKAFAQIQTEQMIAEKERLLEQNRELYIESVCLEQAILDNKERVREINRKLDWVANYPTKTIIVRDDCE